MVRPRRSKYGSVPKVVDGIRFASTKEARRYQELKLLHAAKEITGLTVQPRFKLEVNGQRIATYIGDFSYCVLSEGGFVYECVEDVKGVRTKDYIIKAKLMKAIHGITIRETR